MGQEFFIKSTNLEDKVRELLPSQGGLGAGFDLSASTQIVPIVDLTESAEGSNLRQDLQRSLSYTTSNDFDVSNSTDTIITNTGYFTITAGIGIKTSASGSAVAGFIINDGTTDKNLFGIVESSGADNNYLSEVVNFDVFLEAGHSLKVQASVGCNVRGSFRQIADISGSLTNP